MLKKTVRSIRKSAQEGRSRFSVVLATCLDYLYFYSTSAKPSPTAPTDSEYLSKTKEQLKKEGICVIENYWSPEQCAKVRDEIDRILVEHPDFIHPHSKADFRVFGAENLSNEIAQFSTDTFLGALASDYNREPSAVAFTLAGKLPESKNNKGSGEGWHRDAFFRQFKSIIYLTDVEKMNGPFQFIQKSHSFWQVLKDVWIAKLGYMQYRIKDEQAEAIVNDSPSRLKTYTAKVGTLILVDTSSIHRGMPIESGVRYALTNYFYPSKRIQKELFEQFAPIAGVIDANKNFII